MKKRARVLSVLLMSLVAASLAVLGAAEEPAHHPTPAGGEPEIRLSEPLRQALAEEMLAIQNAMMDLVPSLAAGEWSEVAKLGRRIEGSYIMKQKLSADEMEELHRALPAGFQELDSSFHEMAGMLAHVAEEGHVELVHFYFYKLNESCVTCHRRYAGQRFPAFSAGSPEPRHAH